MKTDFDLFLESFFDYHIEFLGNKTLQQQIWGGAETEEPFATRILMYFEDWYVVVEQKNNFKLSDSKFKKLEQLYDMVNSYQLANNYPQKPRDYQALIASPSWREIQKLAAELYQTK